MPRSELSEASGSQAQRVAILIPCFNEERSIAAVIREFRAQLPSSEIYVFDNNSTDRTVEEANRAGAIVRHERRQGKGYVIRSMFRQVEADLYIMVDGDGTYPADRVHDLVKPILAGEADAVIGSRLLLSARSRFKLPNLAGNLLFRVLVNALFRVQVTDLLSGYRAFSREVVKGLPFLSHGFESETELTVKCLERGYRIVEVPVQLSPRPSGSRSKIRLVQDGIIILRTLLGLVRDYKPLTGFGLLGLFVVGCGLIPGVIVIKEFLATGQVLRLPSAILSVGLILVGLSIGFVGLVLHSITRHFQELDYQVRELLVREQKPGAASAARVDDPQ